MGEPSLQSQIDAARAYESIMVPALFQEWAEPVLDAAEVQADQRVLDVACGTGVLARAASERVGSGGAVAGLDPSQGMLAVAGELTSGVEWHSGTAEAAPFPDGSFDAVVCQFGLMFFGDRAAAVREMLRVLKPGGGLALAVWDTLEDSPAYAVEVSILEKLAGPEAANALRAPFVLGDPAETLGLLQEAGVASPSVLSKTGTAKFPSVRVMVEADLRGWLPVMGVHLTEQQISEIFAEAESALAEFVTRSGEIVFDSPAHIVSGRRCG